MIESLSEKNIFITEDDAMNRVVYMMILKSSGANLEFDRWGRDTPFKLRQFKPDLIIMDLMLARQASGYEVFDEVRQNPDFDDVPIVAISASDPTYALPKCREMGFSGYIAKPVEEELLIEQLLQIINGQEVWYAGERYGGVS